MEQSNTVFNEQTGMYETRPYTAPPVPVLRSDNPVSGIEYVAVYAQSAAREVTLVTLSAPDVTSELARRANLILDGAVTAVSTSTHD